MADYHRYIYDVAGRRIVGDFEGAYRDCDDVWPSQHDIFQFKYRVVAHLLRELGPGARLADIGAGYGDFVADLVRQGLDATGYEISASAVERGRNRFDLGDRLQTADLKHGIPAPDASFDIVSLFGVFWYLLDHLEASIAEMKRVLKPKGHLVVSLSMVPNPIGGEIVGNYDELLTILRAHFRVGEAMLSYLPADIAAGKPLGDCATDLVIHCHVD